MNPSLESGSHFADLYSVRPVGHALDAVVRVPGSKSIANRAVICATLASGVSELVNVPGGDDTAAMLDCVKALGASVDHLLHDDAVPGVRVRGTDGVIASGSIVLDTRLAGTTSRFVTALCALGSGTYVVDGSAPLRARPMAPLHEALESIGALVEPLGEPGHLPVRIGGVRRGGHHEATRSVAIRGDVSSQYITALMLIAPYLSGGLRIELTTPLVSRPYVAITAAVMASFGVNDVEVGERVVTIGPGTYVGCRYTIEPDASSASYPLAAAAVVGGRVSVDGLGIGSMQGDADFALVLESMGCTVTRTDDRTTVERLGELTGISINMADMSDLVPTLAVVAPFASSPTEISGVGFIREKESDRLGDLAAELRTCGVAARELSDGLRVEPGVRSGGILATHHDHRLAMAFGVLGLRQPGIDIGDPGVVSKSWPEFWTMLETIGGRT